MPYGRKRGNTMAVAGVSTIGVQLFYAVETTVSDSAPTSGYTELTRINDIAEFNIESESIDASALIDAVTRNIPGRQSAGDTWAITVNTTNETITEWETLITAFAAKTAGERVWFQIVSPDLTNAYYIAGFPPEKLPMGAKAQNSLDTFQVSIIVDQVAGYGAKHLPTP